MVEFPILTSENKLSTIKVKLKKQINKFFFEIWKHYFFH
jgi:hypothetical protein